MSTPHLLPRACPVTGLPAAPPGAAEALAIACGATCPAARTAPRRVAEVCADDVERLALAVARYLAAARTTREADCVEAAFAEAEAALPADMAGLFVGAMGGLVRAFEAQAGRAPHMLPASCCRATADEEALVALLARARAGATLPDGRLARAAGAAGRLLAAAAPACAFA